MDTAVCESTEETAEEQKSSNHSLNGGESDPVGTLTVPNSECEQNEADDCCALKTSDGVEESFDPPDEKLLEKIIKQVEYYFSDINIMKDTFLLKHVRRNKEGYVSLKLIASFRKVKSLTKDWRVVAYSLARSEKLEINQECTKIRRKNPLPEFEDTTLAKTVVVFHLPFSKPTVQNVSDLFSNFGNITEVQILNSADAVPPSAKRCLTFHKEASKTTYALVEFEVYDCAVKALQVDGALTGANGMKVVPLLSNSYKKVSPSCKIQKSPANVKNSSQKKQGNGQKRNGRLDQIKSSDMESTTSCSEAEQSPLITRRGSTPDLEADKEKLHSKSRRPNKSKRGISSPRGNGNHNGSRNGRNNNAGNNGHHRNGNGYNSHSRIHNGCGNNNHSKHYNGDTNIINNGINGNSSKCNCKSPHCSEGDGVASSPWVQRRQLAAKDGINTNSSRFLIPEGVIRLPKGPDGTNGFHRSRVDVSGGKTLRSSPALPERSLIVSH